METSVLGVTGGGMISTNTLGTCSKSYKARKRIRCGAGNSMQRR